MQHRVNISAACAVLMMASVVQSCFATAEKKVNENLTYGVSAFTNASSTIPVTTLYIGADDILAPATDVEKAYTLCAATLDTSGAQPAVAVRALAAQTGVVLNGGEAGASPIFGKTVALLGLMNSLPIVSITDDATPDNNKNIYWLGRFDGNIVLKNAVAINDFAGLATEEIVAVAGTGASEAPATIFAAVSANGKLWTTGDGTNRGIALLRQAADNKSLDVYDTTDFSQDTNKACLLTAVTINPISYSLVHVDGDPDASLLWDSTLQRLYCGLPIKGADAVEGGILSVVMGRYAQVGSVTSFVLKPIVYNVTSGHFDIEQTNQLIGYYSAAANSLDATAKNLCIMHTSTGRHYLIFSSEVHTTRGIFAVPLLSGFTDDIDKNGTVSAVDAGGVATFAVPATSNDMPKSSHIPARVFVGQLVKDKALDAYYAAASLFVVGDTVYLCSSKDTNEPAQHNVSSGVFAATALFDKNGAIRGWQYSSTAQDVPPVISNAQPVMGQVGQVVGGGRDAASTGDFYALTTENKVLTEGSFGDVNTVRISHWGSTSYMGIGNLSATLQSIFPADQGGVIGLYSFGRSTPGFATSVGQYFSMLVAIGLNKVAMIQLIKNDATTNELVINTDFQIGTNVFVFDTTTNPALASIAPLTYAEWSRIPYGTRAPSQDKKGWFFVAGRNGVAVLSAHNGDGAQLPLNGLGSLASDNYPVGLTFKKLIPDNDANFAHVRKLVARNSRLYVVTRRNVYYFDMTAAKFADVPNALGVGTVLLPDAWIADMAVFAPSVGVAADNRGVIATSSGLYASNLDDTSLLINNTPTDRFAVQLQVLADQPGGATNGNIYALLTDMTNDAAQKPNDKLYRFDVPDAAAVDLTTFAQPVIVPNASGLMREFNSYEQNIDDDGAFLYSTMPWNYGTIGNVNLYLQNTAMDSSFNVLPLLKETGRVTGVMHDEATGIIMVPGQSSGMSVNG